MIPIQVAVAAGISWSRRWDSNPQPADYKSAALPLSYAGQNQCFSLYHEGLQDVKQLSGRGFGSNSRRKAAIMDSVEIFIDIPCDRGRGEQAAAGQVRRETMKSGTAEAGERNSSRPGNAAPWSARFAGVDIRPRRTMRKNNEQPPVPISKAFGRGESVRDASAAIAPLHCAKPPGQTSCTAAPIPGVRRLPRRGLLLEPSSRAETRPGGLCRCFCGQWESVHRRQVFQWLSCRLSSRERDPRAAIAVGVTAAGT